LPPEFTEARDAIADRIVRLSAVHQSSIAQAFRIDHDARLGRVILVSERVPGLRLSELLRRASEQSVVPDLPAALFLMRRLLSIARSARASAGVAQLGIAPDRIVIKPRGEIVVIEAAVGAAIEARARAESAELGTGGDIPAIALAG